MDNHSFCLSLFVDWNRPSFCSLCGQCVCQLYCLVFLAEASSSHRDFIYILTGVRYKSYIQNVSLFQSPSSLYFLLDDISFAIKLHYKLCLFIMF